MGRKYQSLAVLDCETDPFKYGRVPKPFALEFYSADVTQQFWGHNCVERFVDWIEAYSPERKFIIYAHNGGKFDFHFLAKYIGNPIKIINSRIVKAALFQHELRDSFAILPVPLGTYNKVKIDYAKFEAVRRERHKEEILNYLHHDCLYLFDLVAKFLEQFAHQGRMPLTIGSTAMREIKSLYEFEQFTPSDDAIFRPYYFGGRVQCFESGVLKGPWKLFDVNSSYPNAMRNYKHPINRGFDSVEKMPRSFKKPFFVKFIGKNNNALPTRTKTGLTFERDYGEFMTCSHELEVALDHGLVEIDRVLQCIVPYDTITFEDYVDKFFAQKLAAEKAGDKAGRLFAKLFLNSGYGKFGQNPENFKDYLIVRDEYDEEELEAMGYSLDMDFDDYQFWARPTTRPETGLINVATAASITSAARATLLDGLQHARDPIYCDTDSIICRAFSGPVHKSKLGAWDIEAESKLAAIAGKKLYAMFNDKNDKPPSGDKLKGECAKLVSKGGTLTLKDIIKICGGGTVKYRNAAPTFSLRKKPSFVTRKFKLTVDNGASSDDDDNT